MDKRHLLDRHLSLLVASALLMLTALHGHARVFQRWDSRDNVAENLQKLGGKVAYTSSVKINGGEGKLTVLSIDDANAQTLAKIQTIFDLSGTPSPGSTAIYTIHSEHNVVRLVIINLPEAERLLAITIEQSKNAFNSSKQRPIKHLMKSIPPYPGSTPTFFAEDSNTEMQLAVSETTAVREAVWEFYRGKLEADGWTQTLSSEFGHAGTMPFYIRHGEIFCLFVSEGDKPGQQRIAMLHKKLGN